MKCTHAVCMAGMRCNLIGSGNGLNVISDLGVPYGFLFLLLFDCKVCLLSGLIPVPSFEPHTGENKHGNVQKCGQ